MSRARLAATNAVTFAIVTEILSSESSSGTSQIMEQRRSAFSNLFGSFNKFLGVTVVPIIVALIAAGTFRSCIHTGKWFEVRLNDGWSQISAYEPVAAL